MFGECVAWVSRDQKQGKQGVCGSILDCGVFLEDRKGYWLPMSAILLSICFMLSLSIAEGLFGIATHFASGLLASALRRWVLSRMGS